MNTRRAILMLFVVLLLIPSLAFGYEERPRERAFERTQPGDPDFPEGIIDNTSARDEENSAAPVVADIFLVLQRFLIQFTGGL